MITPEAWQEYERLRGKYREALFSEECAAGDYGAALALCASEEVAGALCKLAPSLSDAQLRELQTSESATLCCVPDSAIHRAALGLLRRWRCKPTAQRGR